MLIKQLEALGYSSTKAQQDGVVIRFGHATHATPEQVERMAKLGVIVEANIGSNLITGSIIRAEEHPLLLNLYYGLETVLGTDAGGVMQTTRQREYAFARDLIEQFRTGKPLEFPNGKRIYFKDLTPEQQARFALDEIHRSEDRYHANVVAGDRRDSARRQGGGGS